MNLRKLLLCTVLSGLCLFGSVGCGSLALTSALAKLASGAVGDLTADEIAALSQLASDAINAEDPTAGLEPFTPAQSQAIVDFLDVNGVNTLEELEALIAAAETDPTAVQGLEELAEAFGFDPMNPSPDDFNEVLLPFN